MLFRCFVLLFCLTAISAQKGGGRNALPSESSPAARAVALAGRKTAEPSEKIQQVQEPDREPEEDTEVASGVRPARPQPVEDSGEGPHPAPEPYSFSYSVDDPETGASSSREETQDASGEIVGYYNIKDQDGRTRRVDYTAGKDGFKATIKSNEEGLNSRAPADVKVELSASPSERIPQYAPNNRPLASESSIKSLGKPAQSKFFQKLLPTPTTRLPPPPPPPEPQPQDTQDDPEITQQRNVDEIEEPVPFESVKGGAPPPSRPRPRPRPPLREQQPQPLPSTPRFEPTQRPVGIYTPSRNQVYSEQREVNLQPQEYSRIEPQDQYQDDFPLNRIEEVQQTLEGPPPPPPPPRASTKTTPSAPVLPPPRQYIPGPPPPPPPQQVFIKPPRPIPARPLAPPPPRNYAPITTQILSPRQSFRVQDLPAAPPPPPPIETIVSYPPLPATTLLPPPPPPPLPTLPPPTKTRPALQYRSSAAATPQPPAPQSVPDYTPSGPPTSNIIFGQQHREPITQQQLLQFFQPTQPLFASSPQQPIVFDASPPRPIQLYSSLNNEGQNSMSYIPPQQTPQTFSPQIPQSDQDYRIVVHREQDTYQLQPQVYQQQEPQQEPEQIVKETARQLPPPPPPPPQLQPLPSLPPPPPRPLPTPLPQQRRQVFEPQVYEPQTQQSYEPLQQVYEPPQQALEDVIQPQTKCDCGPKAEQTQVSYGIKGAQSEPAPVKGGRISPSRSLNYFLPQAFRTRRDSTKAESDSVDPSSSGSDQISVINLKEGKSEAN